MGFCKNNGGVVSYTQAILMSLYSLKVNEPKTIVKMFIPPRLIAKVNASLLKTGRIYYFLNLTKWF